MKSLNRVTLLGNVGRDPEVRYTQGGTPVANFSLATTENRTDKDPVTDWHNIVAWQKLAEIVGEYVTKGTRLYVEGRLKTRSWDDKHGKKQYRTEVYASNIIMLDKSDKIEDAGFEPDVITDDDIPF